MRAPVTASKAVAFAMKRELSVGVHACAACNIWLEDRDYYGDDIGKQHADSRNDCLKICRASRGCNAMTYVAPAPTRDLAHPTERGTCYMKSIDPDTADEPVTVSIVATRYIEEFGGYWVSFGRMHAGLQDDHAAAV